MTNKEEQKPETIAELEERYSQFEEGIEKLKRELKSAEEQMESLIRNQSKSKRKRRDLQKEKEKIEDSLAISKRIQRKVEEKRKRIEKSIAAEDSPERRRKLIRKRWELEDKLRNLEKKVWEEESQMSEIKDEKSYLEKELFRMENKKQRAVKSASHLEKTLRKKETAAERVKEKIEELKSKKKEEKEKNKLKIPYQEAADYFENGEYLKVQFLTEFLIRNAEPKNQEKLIEKAQKLKEKAKKEEKKEYEKKNLFYREEELKSGRLGKVTGKGFRIPSLDMDRFPDPEEFGYNEDPGKISVTALRKLIKKMEKDSERLTHDLKEMESELEKLTERKEKLLALKKVMKKKLDSLDEIKSTRPTLIMGDWLSKKYDFYKKIKDSTDEELKKISSLKERREKINETLKKIEIELKEAEEELIQEKKREKLFNRYEEAQKLYEQSNFLESIFILLELIQKLEEEDSFSGLLSECFSLKEKVQDEELAGYGQLVISENRKIVRIPEIDIQDLPEINDSSSKKLKGKEDLAEVKEVLSEWNESLKNLTRKEKKLKEKLESVGEKKERLNGLKKLLEEKLSVIRDLEEKDKNKKQRKWIKEKKRWLSFNLKKIEEEENKLAEARNRKKKAGQLLKKIKEKIEKGEDRIEEIKKEKEKKRNQLKKKISQIENQIEEGKPEELKNKLEELKREESLEVPEKKIKKLEEKLEKKREEKRLDSELNKKIKKLLSRYEEVEDRFQKEEYLKALFLIDSLIDDLKNSDKEVSEKVSKKGNLLKKSSRLRKNIVDKEEKDYRGEGSLFSFVKKFFGNKKIVRIPEIDIQDLPDLDNSELKKLSGNEDLAKIKETVSEWKELLEKLIQKEKKLKEKLKSAEEKKERLNGLKKLLEEKLSVIRDLEEKDKNKKQRKWIKEKKRWLSSNLKKMRKEEKKWTKIKKKGEEIGKKIEEVESLIDQGEEILSRARKERQKKESEIKAVKSEIPEIEEIIEKGGLKRARQLVSGLEDRLKAVGVNRKEVDELAKLKKTLKEEKRRKKKKKEEKKAERIFLEAKKLFEEEQFESAEKKLESLLQKEDDSSLGDDFFRRVREMREKINLRLKKGDGSSKPKTESVTGLSVDLEKKLADAGLDLNHLSDMDREELTKKEEIDEEDVEMIITSLDSKNKKEKKQEDRDPGRIETSGPEDRQKEFDDNDNLPPFVRDKIKKLKRIQWKRLFADKHWFMGIDLSDYSIEMLILNENKSVFTYGRTRLGKGIIKDGEIVDQKKLSERLEEVLENAYPFPVRISDNDKDKAIVLKREKYKAVVSLPESRTFVHLFTFNDKKNFNEKVKKKIKMIIPHDPDELYWDTREVPTVGEEVKIICVAAQKEIVDSYTFFFKSTKLDLAAFEIEGFSVGRSLLPIKKIKREDGTEKLVMADGKDRMVLDMGAKTSTLNMYDKRGSLVVSVPLPYGGNYFTREIAKNLGETTVDAERIKRENGFKKEGDIYEIMEKHGHKIVDEIEEARDYYQREFSSQVEEVLLTGGTALLPGITDFFEGQFEDLNFKTGSPLKKIDAPDFLEEKESVLYSNVVGLALRGLRKDPIDVGVNLLPEEVKKQERKDEIEDDKPLFIISVFILFSGLFLLGAALFNFRNMAGQVQFQELPERDLIDIDRVPGLTDTLRDEFSRAHTLMNEEELEEEEYFEELYLQLEEEFADYDGLYQQGEIDSYAFEQKLVDLTNRMRELLIEAEEGQLSEEGDEGEEDENDED